MTAQQTVAITARPPGARLAQVDRFVGAISTALGVVSSVLCLILMAVILADVGTRFLTGSSLVGAFELAETILVLVVFCGLSYVERTNGNVQVTLVTNLLPKRVAHWVRSFASLVALVITVWFAKATIALAIDSVGILEYETGLIHFPLWPARIAVAVGFTVLSLEFATKVLKEVTLAVSLPQEADAGDAEVTAAAKELS